MSSVVIRLNAVEVDALRNVMNNCQCWKNNYTTEDEATILDKVSKKLDSAKFQCDYLTRKGKQTCRS